jgi:hypothetical protein
MMTCKDCYHYDVCKFYNKNLPEEYDPIEWQCDNFKNKSLVVELPCRIKVGQTVYVILCDNNNIYKISKMEIKIIKPFGSVDYITTNNNDVNDSGIKTPFVWNMFLIDDFYYFYKFSFNDVGTKIFLTKEEAEEKLKELNNKIH